MALPGTTMNRKERKVRKDKQHFLRIAVREAGTKMRFMLPAFAAEKTPARTNTSLRTFAPLAVSASVI